MFVIVRDVDIARRMRRRRHGTWNQCGRVAQQQNDNEKVPSSKAMFRGCCRWDVGMVGWLKTMMRVIDGSWLRAEDDS